MYLNLYTLYRDKIVLSLSLNELKLNSRANFILQQLKIFNLNYANILLLM